MEDGSTGYSFGTISSTLIASCSLRSRVCTFWTQTVVCGSAWINTAGTRKDVFLRCIRHHVYWRGVIPSKPWQISVAAVIVTMMAIQMASLGFLSLLPAMQKDLAASYSQMSLFTGMYGIIALLVSPSAGVFSTRIGEKNALLIGLAGTAIGLAALSRAEH